VFLTTANPDHAPAQMPLAVHHPEQRDSQPTCFAGAAMELLSRQTLA